MKLQGKTVVVTGGSGGIGSEIVRRVTSAGGRCIVLDRVKNDALPAEFIAGDLSSMESALAAGQAIAAVNPDILINLAGIQYFGIFEAQAPEALARMYAVNLVAPVLLAQAVLPGMKQRKSGQIVNIGSVFGSIGFAHFVTYSSAKAGLKGFSESLRRELAGSGIGVTHISPRAVKTALNDARILKLAERTRMNMDAPEKVAARIIQAIENDAKDVYIGFPECAFVRINALLPRAVDGALAKNDRIAASLLNGQ